jgi:putative alpha-1,2-mannosidase
MKTRNPRARAAAKLNGRPLTVPVIRYEEILGGMFLKLVMGPEPSNWADD